MNVMNVLLTLKTTIFNYIYNSYENIYNKYYATNIKPKPISEYSTTHFDSSNNLNELQNDKESSINNGLIRRNTSESSFSKIIKKISFNTNSKPVTIQQNIIYDNNDYIGYNICYTCNKQIVTLYSIEYRYKDHNVCKKCYTNIQLHISNSKC